MTQKSGVPGKKPNLTKAEKKSSLKAGSAPKKPAGEPFRPAPDWGWAMILFLIAAALYVNTLGHGYVLDDHSVIDKNFVVTKGVQGIPQILQTPYRYGFHLLNDHLYRPLSLVMFAAEWEIAPGNPLFGHLINLLFYALSGALLFHILRRMLPGRGLMMPFLITLLWICHPVHTEVVANIKSRDEIMAGFFLFAAVLAFISYLRSGRLLTLAGAAGAYGLALFSKEGVVTFLVLFPVIGWYLDPGRKKKILIASVMMVLPVAAYLVIRHSVLSAYPSPPGVPMDDNFLAGIPGFTDRVATAMRLLGKYLVLLAFPFTLVSDYSYSQLPASGPGDPIAWISFILYAALIVFAITNFRKRSFMAFGVILFLITISLYSNMVMLIGTAFAERLLYLPSLGFIIAAATATQYLFNRRIPGHAMPGVTDTLKGQRLVVAILGVVCLFYMVRTVFRNADWSDDLTLTSADVVHSPNSAKMRAYHGVALRDQALGVTDPSEFTRLMRMAADEFRKSVEISPNHAEGYEQLGLACYRLKEPEESLRNYETALKINPRKATTWSNIGIIYVEKGDHAKALELYRKAVELDPAFEDAWVNLGSTYGNLGRLEDAVSAFRTALALNPGNARSHYFLGITYRSLNKPEMAARQLDSAARLDERYRKL